MEEGDQADINPGDGICLTATGLCSFRAAIQETNAYPNTTDFDIITFRNIPLLGGKAKIFVTGYGLPQITEAVKIRGGTSPTGRVRIDGSNTIDANGIHLRHGSAGSIVRGMVIGNFPLSGILVEDSDIKIQHSEIGTNLTGEDLGNGAYGIHCDWGNGGLSRDILIGGVDAGNTLGFNELGGISLSHAYWSRIVGNRIGVCPDNSNCGNIGPGIISLQVINTIGGPTPDHGNTIGFNETGILLDDSSNAEIQNNFIGVTSDGEDIGNVGSGIELSGLSFSTHIGYDNYSDIPGPDSLHNTIAYNGGNGVLLIDSFTDATIRGNIMYSNGALGIDLQNDGFTSNDAGDADSGPNGLQNYPNITRVGFNEVREVVIFEYDLDADTAYTFYPLEIDFYIADSPISGEGKTYIGSHTYTTPGALVEAEFELTDIAYTDEDVFVATATDLSRHTSEFSPPTVSVGNAFFTSTPTNRSHPDFEPANKSGIEIPGTHLLSSAYPNPFNPLTSFSLTVKESGPVRISVHDALGRQVALLHEGLLTSGTTHTYRFDGAGLTSGLYLLRIAGSGFSETQQLVLMK